MRDLESIKRDNANPRKFHDRRVVQELYHALTNQAETPEAWAEAWSTRAAERRAINRPWDK